MKKVLLVVALIFLAIILANNFLNKQPTAQTIEKNITQNQPATTRQAVSPTLKVLSRSNPDNEPVAQTNNNSGTRISPTPIADDITFRPGILIPQIIVQGSYKPITIQDLQIKTSVVGNVASTTYEMTLYNPNGRTLEAEFIFPMTENQTIAAVALDINGKMREGVVVEKTKARQTFEAVVRQGVDPLLVEKTSGNQFKTRIYPFSPNGTRKIRIVLEEFLNKEKGNFKYDLPLQFKQTLKTFSLDIEIPSRSSALPEISTNLPDFHFTKVEQVVRSHFEAQDYLLDNALSFKLPEIEANQVFTHTENNKTYFYGNLDVSQQEKEKKLPKKIALVWDSSLSGNKRNIKKEKDLLKAYLQKLNNVEVSFISFNLAQGETKNLSVKKGNASQVLALIDQVIYDGATSFNKLDLKKIKADEILLFTDGVNTFDNQIKLSLPNIPMYTINSSSQYEPSLLKGWANKTFGSFVNLTSLDSSKALSLLTRQPLRIINYKANNVKEIYPAVGNEVDENLSIAGILTSANADLEVVLGYDNSTPVTTKKISIKSEGKNPAVARLWAMKKIQDLEQDAQNNKEKILELGQTFSIVTEGTSLLVLENASDYARYDITPPAELLSEYNQIKKNTQREEDTRKQDAWKDAKNQAEDVKSWWKKDFKIPEIKPGSSYQPLRNPVIHNSTYGDDEMAVTEEASYSSSSSSLRRDESSSARRVARSVRASASELESYAAADAFEGASYDSANMSASEDALEIFSEDSSSSRSSGGPSIQVKAWDPDTPYLKILKASKDEELYKDYLKIKTGYNDQPSFYFDIADEFIRRGKTKEAMLVLSNITEMQVDNVELLRIAANKLMQMKQYDYAVELFEKITKLRDEDPQSFRDLALAYWAKGDYQKAFEQFYFVLQKNWARSNEVKQIVFVELNNLLTQHPEINKKDLPKELVFKMPVDIRIVLAWSTDNTDIDLHVVDPIGEECYYGHKNTQIGGRYAYDFRIGFGPEEFMLKKAADGKYNIRTNNFADSRQSISGPSTLYLDIYTNYARPNEKHERIFVRTENVKDSNTIGEIIWGKDTKK